MNEQVQEAMMHQQQQLLQPPLISLNHNLMSMNQIPQPQPQMLPMNRSYGVWPPPPRFQSTNSTARIVNVKPPLAGFKKMLGPRSNWKGKKAGKPNDKRRIDQQKALMSGSIPGTVNMMEAGGSSNPIFTDYQPPTLNELQYQNRQKTRKFFQKKFNKNNGVYNYMDMGGGSGYRTAPYAPRNTTSFIIRAKKSGGIASLVSPSPMTPATLPTPIFSPSREVLVDMAKEEWGVDGYGSMKGLIRLRSPGHELETNEDDEEDEGGSSDSDVEGHVELERRLDQDLSRFEMIYNPNANNLSGLEYHNVLENRVDDQDSHIAQLEEENLILKERLFLMERELGDLRRRMQFLERKHQRDDEEVVDNGLSDENNVHRAVSSTTGKDNDGFEAAAVAEEKKVEEADENTDLVGDYDGDGKAGDENDDSLGEKGSKDDDNAEAMAEN